jgi:ACT domain-containing protein
MGELGTENLVLSVLKKNPDVADKELIKKSGVSRGTFYRYKKILHSKGVI